MLTESVKHLRTTKTIGAIAVCVIFAAISVSAKGDQIFRGIITDSKCAATGSHPSNPGAGESDARCEAMCVKQGAKYVLLDADSKAIYQLGDQKGIVPFAARNVIVVGILDKETATIHIDDVLVELAPEVKQAKTVAVVCDACPRAMAKANRVAFEELTAWHRFTVVPDGNKADLVVLISANPYVGDYVTRDGPDKRPVNIATVYMNVVDPKTGASLWGDSETRGSWFVAGATKALIDSFKAQFELDENSAAREAFVERHAVPKVVPDNGK